MLCSKHENYREGLRRLCEKPAIAMAIPVRKTAQENPEDGSVAERGTSGARKEPTTIAPPTIAPAQDRAPGASGRPLDSRRTTIRPPVTSAAETRRGASTGPTQGRG